MLDIHNKNEAQEAPPKPSRIFDVTEHFCFSHSFSQAESMNVERDDHGELKMRVDKLEAAVTQAGDDEPGLER